MTLAVAVPCAGTVTWSRSTENCPALPGWAVGESGFSMARSSVVALSPLLVKVTVCSVSLPAPSDQPAVVVRFAGEARTVCRTAVPTSTRPVPCWYGARLVFGSALFMSAVLICSPFQSGCAWATSAAEPATCGVAIDVPLLEVWPPPIFAATMLTPGAVMSGLTALSLGRGPRLENAASSSSASTAPTARAAFAMAGAPTVPVPYSPSLPAATTKSVPLLADRSLMAAIAGSVSSAGPPRLMLTTLAWTVLTAQSMPARTAEVGQEPVLSQTLPTASDASGATPR